MTKREDQPNKEEVKVTKPKSPDKCQKGLSRHRTTINLDESKPLKPSGPTKLLAKNSMVDG